MEPKKSPSKDLERRKALFLQIGLILSLSVTLLAFEFSTPYGPSLLISEIPGFLPDEDIIPVTRPPEPPRPIAPPIQQTLTFTLTNDTASVTTDPLLFTSEIRPTDSVAFVVPVPEPEVTDPVPFIAVEDIPLFRPDRNKTREQSEADLIRFIASSIQYPRDAVLNDVSGRVWVEFVVGKDGRVGSVRLAKGTDPLLDEEALRVIRLLPPFSPGRQAGKPVPVVFTVPVQFIIR